MANLVHAFFDTFGIIHPVTAGGQARATEILVCKVFRDGFIALDLGASAAQSVILMLIVITLAAPQSRYIERRVQYP
jgi:sn-glycerol 3-phosphate transport system permease protein